MIIQERDREILRCCYEQQFMVVEQVKRYFFKDRLECNAYVRIQELERAGLVKREQTLTLDGRRIIRLTREGLRYVRNFHPVEIPQAKTIDQSTMRHDAIVASVSLRLREFWDATWIPERALKKGDYAQIPDGIFVFNSGTKVAVEVENSQKYRTRFMGILERWRDTDIEMVLFVTTAPHIFRLLQTYLKEAPKNILFGLADWDALKQGAPEVWSTEGVINPFSKRSF